MSWFELLGLLTFGGVVIDGIAIFFLYNEISVLTTLLVHDERSDNERG